MGMTPKKFYPRSRDVSAGSRAVIRSAVQSTYDIQNMRIRAGGRVVAAFRDRLGIDPGQPDVDVDDDAQGVLDTLREEYRLVSKAMAKNQEAAPEVDNPLITSLVEFRLVETFMKLHQVEADSFKSIAEVIEGEPLWESWLKHQVGIGPAMGGALIAIVDWERARNPSSLYRLFGVDQDWRPPVGAVAKLVADLEAGGEPESGKLGDWFRVRARVGRETGAPDGVYCLVYADGEEARIRNIAAERGLVEWSSADGEPISDEAVACLTTDDAYLMFDQSWDGPRPTHATVWVHDPEKNICTGARDKRKFEQQMRQFVYIDADGKPEIRRGLGYNPWAKMMLMGRVFTQFLKAVEWIDADAETWGSTREEFRRIKQRDGNDVLQVKVIKSPFAREYYDDKFRLERHETWGVHNDKVPLPGRPEKSKATLTSPAKRHGMARRRAMQFFLNEMYAAGRKAYGLEVREPYAVAKLGHRRHRVLGSLAE